MTAMATINNPDKHSGKKNQAYALGDSRTPATKAAHDVSLLRLKAREAEKMAQVDTDELLAGLAAGKTQGELAKLHGINGSTLSIWLNTQTGDMGKAIAAARRCAADGFADRALEALTSREGSESSPDVTLGGLLAKHLQWRAAMSDRARYHDKGEIAQQSANTNAPPPQFTVQIINNSQSNQEVRIIEHDAGENLI